MSATDWIKKFFGVSSDAGMYEDVMQLPPEDEMCLIDGKPIAITLHPLRNPVHTRPDDILTCRVHNEEVVREKINETCTIDTVVTFRVKDALGLEHGIGAVFGKRRRNAG